MAALITNNAAGTLNGAITLSATSLALGAGQGALFPNPTGGAYFYATLVDTSLNVEIIKVTARSTDTFSTIVRAQDNTTAKAFSNGDVVEIRPTAALFAETAKTADLQTFTASQRGTVTTNNTVSFDMNATNNFRSTPTVGGALTFTNITAGQSGNIHLINGSNYAITAAATTKMSTADLAIISASGTYWISYYCYDGANVVATTSGNVAA